MKYIKKPVVIEAIKWDGDYGAVEELFGGTSVTGISQEFTCLNPSTGSYAATGKLKIKTLEGIMTANEGDFIIRGVKGEFYPCKPDIFEATYEAVL